MSSPLSVNSWSSNGTDLSSKISFGSDESIPAINPHKPLNLNLTMIVPQILTPAEEILKRNEGMAKAENKQDVSGQSIQDKTDSDSKSFYKNDPDSPKMAYQKLEAEKPQILRKFGFSHPYYPTNDQEIHEFSMSKGEIIQEMKKNDKKTLWKRIRNFFSRSETVDVEEEPDSKKLKLA